MFLCSDLPQTYPSIDTNTSISVSAAHQKEKVPTVSKTQCISSGRNWLFNWINWISTWREGCSTPVVPIPLSLPLLTDKLLFHLLLQLDQNLGAPEQDMKLRVYMGLLLAMLLALVLLSQGGKKGGKSITYYASSRNVISTGAETTDARSTTPRSINAYETLTSGALTMDSTIG